MKKKVIAIVLAVSVLLSAFVIPASANTGVTKIIDTLVGGIAALIKSPKWDAKKDYVSENFYSGTDEFLDAPADGAHWSVGYANASLLTGKELEGDYYVGGSLSVTKKLATEVRDDQKVRTVAIWSSHRD